MLVKVMNKNIVKSNSVEPQVVEASRAYMVQIGYLASLFSDLPEQYFP